MQQCNAMKSPIIQIFSNEDIEKTYNHKSTFYRQIVLKIFLFPTNYCSLCLVFSNDLAAEGGAPPLLRPWNLHIGTLIDRLTAEPCSTAGLLFSSRCPSGTVLLTPYSMAWDWRVSRAGPMLLYWPKLLYYYYSLLLFFNFSSFCF